MDLCTKQISLVFRRVGSVLGKHNSAVKVTHCCRHIRVISTSTIKSQEFPDNPVLSQDVQPSPAAIIRPHLPVITSRKLEHLHPCLTPQQAWLETLDTIEDEKLGVIDLHPEIFATNPRIDILHRNVQWQTKYKRINYEKTKSRAELRGGGRKPWPQKGMNKARHGSIRSPLWVHGGKATGPRGPKSYFYMLPTPVRVLGLRVALSVKYAQNDLHIVDSLKIPTDDEKYIEDLVEQRHWGYSALFVDVKDFMPRNISLALSKTKEFNLMPVYGLNVYSILKHETLVLTLDAVEELEKKLLYQMHKTEADTKFHSHRGIASYSVPDWRK